MDLMRNIGKSIANRAPGEHYHHEPQRATICHALRYENTNNFQEDTAERLDELLRGLFIKLNMPLMRARQSPNRELREFVQCVDALVSGILETHAIITRLADLRQRVCPQNTQAQASPIGQQFVRRSCKSLIKIVRNISDNISRIDFKLYDFSRYLAHLAGRLVLPFETQRTAMQQLMQASYTELNLRVDFAKTLIRALEVSYSASVTAEEQSQPIAGRRYRTYTGEWRTKQAIFGRRTEPAGRQVQA
jgi:hypothetical protein